MHILAGMTGLVLLAREALGVDAPQIVAREPNHREVIAPDGTAVLDTNRRTELTDGMHYQNQNGSGWSPVKSSTSCRAADWLPRGRTGWVWG